MTPGWQEVAKNNAAGANGMIGFSGAGVMPGGLAGVPMFRMTSEGSKMESMTDRWGIKTMHQPPLPAHIALRWLVGWTRLLMIGLVIGAGMGWWFSPPEWRSGWRSMDDWFSNRYPLKHPEVEWERYIGRPLGVPLPTGKYTLTGREERGRAVFLELTLEREDSARIAAALRQKVGQPYAEGEFVRSIWTIKETRLESRQPGRADQRSGPFGPPEPESDPTSGFELIMYCVTPRDAPLPAHHGVAFRFLDGGRRLAMESVYDN